MGWVGSVTAENSAVRPYPHPLDSFGFPSAQTEGTDTGHREKVEIHRPNCLTVAVTQRARQGLLLTQLVAKAVSLPLILSLSSKCHAKTELNLFG